MLTLETGLSDFYKMTVAAFQSEFQHLHRKMISHRSYKYFNKNSFQKDIKNAYCTEDLARRFFSL